MSKDLENLLGADEKIIHETRQHPFIIIRDGGLTVLVLALLAVAIWYVGDAGWLDNDFGTYVGYVIWIGFTAAAMTLLWKVLGWFTERFYLTTSKVVYARGILNRDVVATPLVKIDEITLKRPLLGRIFGFGRLEVENASGGSEPLAGLEYLPKPDALYRMVTERSRSQRMIEGGHRDDDNDGIVDRPTPKPTPAGQQDASWTPPGDSTSSS